MKTDEERTIARDKYRNSPEAQHKQKECSNRYRARNRGKCVDCDKELPYNTATRCRQCSNIGENNPHWKGGLGTRKKYIVVYSPDHPYKDCRNYVLEHRLVVEEQIRRYLEPQEVVHHINEMKTDNRPENLMLFENDMAHQYYTGYIKFDQDSIIWDGRTHGGIK